MRDLLLNDNIDVLALTETRMRPEDLNAVLLDIASDGYTVHQALCTTGRGGGLAILHPNSVSVKMQMEEQTSEFESQRMMVSCAGESVELLDICGPVSTTFRAEL